VKERTKELNSTNEELHSTVEELKISHAEIRTKNDHLTDLNREKDGMMDVVAHDLKSPLNNIEGLISLLPLEGSLTHEQQQHIDRIINQVYSGKNLINDLLDIHSYGHEGSQLNFSEFSLNQYVSDLLPSYTSLLEKKNQHIVAEFKNGETSLSTDKNILRRIVDNLLTNAMKFSGNGTTVALTCLQEDGLVKISIADQGPGISEEDQKKMFKMFQKLSARPTGGESSNGLGLSIIKTLTEKLKGTIEVKSKVGKGTEFIISLPS
jgi:signal transduction histidine kinase